jgi:X-X-X-Leu-X-X-Gly heptad repeat protein
MQDWLRKAADEATLLGIPLDDNTQSLIDQSKELGIWKKEGQDATSKLTTGMQTLVDKVGELIDKLGKIPDVSFNINGEYNPPQIPGQPDVPGFATGTQGKLIDFGPRGTLVTLHNQERLQTKSEAMTADKSKVIDIVPLLDEVRRLRADVGKQNEYFRTTFGTQLARATGDEGQKASRR